MEPFSESYSARSSGDESYGLQSNSWQELDEPVICQGDIRRDFKLLVKNIADNITSDHELHNLRYLSDLRQAKSALDVLWELERKGEIAFNNVGALEKLLKEINRCELVTKYIEPYKDKYGELAINGASQTEQKKPLAMRRVGSSPLPQTGSPMTTAKRSARSLPPSYHPAPDRRLNSLPQSIRFSTVPEEESAQSYQQLKELAYRPGPASLPSGATLVPHSHSWAMCAGDHTLLPYNQQPSDEHQPAFLVPAAPRPDFSNFSLPSNLSRLPERPLVSGYPSLPCHNRTESRPVVCGACGEKMPGENEHNVFSSIHSQHTSTPQHRSPDQPHDLSSLSLSRAATTGLQETGSLQRKTAAQRTEQAHSWDVEQQALFKGLKSVGKSLKQEKFTLPVGASKSHCPVVTLKVIPQDNARSRHVSLTADVMIPRKCSRRKWLVEYCVCSYVLIVKVINLTTNEVVCQEEVQKDLVCSSPATDTDHRTQIKLSKLVCHDEIIYNRNAKQYKFHATLCLLEHGVREDTTAENYQTSSNIEDDFEVIDDVAKI